MSKRSSDSPAVVVQQPGRGSATLSIKRLVQGLFSTLMLWRVAEYRLARRLLGETRAFITISERMARGAGLWGLYCRRAYYGWVLAHCGRDVYIGWQTVFSMREARVGEGSYIGRRCGLGYADIGENAMLADGVQVLSGGQEHATTTNADQTHQDMPQTYRPVRIGKGAWIGTNAVLMADVGDHAVVGAGSVVTRPIPDYCVAVGAPARVRRSLKVDGAGADAST